MIRTDDMVTWSECRDSFRSDGSLRDIYILNADASVWESALTLLRTAGELLFTSDGQPGAVPATATLALGMRQTARPVLTLRRDGVDFACHFFSEHEFELDFVPSDIDGPERFGSLVSFLRDLSRATERDVIVTPENQRDRPFLKCDSRSEKITFFGDAGS
ncbi:MAG: hypothetical protein R3A52_26730 [Polyangiales bacterium]